MLGKQRDFAEEYPGFPLKKKHFTISDHEKEKIFYHLEEMLKKERRIQFAYVFGSFIEKLPFHDIDIGILVEGVPHKNALDFSIELSKKILDQIKYPTDIQILNYAPIPFRFYVIIGKLIYVKNEEFHSKFIEETTRRYLDIEPILYRATKEAFSE